MRVATFICTAAALLSATIIAHAAGAPAQLYNKAVLVTFTATATATADDGTSVQRPRVVQRTIYISSKGRIFSRANRQAGRNQDTVDRGPDQTSGSYRFDGNRMVGVNVGYVSGAAQLTVNFDSGFQSCTATVAFGRESGKPFTFKGLNGKTYTATGVPTASTPSCSISDGNPFAQ